MLRPCRSRPNTTIRGGPILQTSSSGELTLEHVLSSAGIPLESVLVLRHTYTSGGLRSEADLSDEKVLEYVRRQEVGNKVGKNPARIWLNFIGEGGLRSRFIVAHENRGEIAQEAHDDHRYFALEVSPLLAALRNRLTIEWSRDPVNWAKRGDLAGNFRVLEIADRQHEPFPGFDNFVLDHSTLGLVIQDARYREWRAALSSVQGVYLITDRSTGKHYVGKADGRDRIFGRWQSYWSNGHGGNVVMKDELDRGFTTPENFQFSALRVFGPESPAEQINAAEKHFKDALLSRPFGLNLN